MVSVVWEVFMRAGHSRPVVCHVDLLSGVQQWCSLLFHVIDAVVLLCNFESLAALIIAPIKVTFSASSFFFIQFLHSFL
jgi:hypothetical protein